MPDRFAVAGETAIVTGGSRGIGRAIAETVAADGVDVAVCSRDADEIEDAASAIAAEYDGDAIGVECDVREREAVESLVEGTIDAFGGVDVLVNNAGASFVASFEDISPNGWDAVVDANLTGTYNCTQAASDALRDGDGGSVVNVASVAGLQGSPTMSHYGAAKAGIVNLTASLAAEWARDDVRVNCVAPGYVATPGLSSQMGIDASEVDRTSVDRTVGTSQEVADVVRFLASPAASFVTGQTIAPRGVPQIEEIPEL